MEFAEKYRLGYNQLLKLQRVCLIKSKSDCLFPQQYLFQIYFYS